MKCPTCRKPVMKDPAAPNKLFPFCSERCHLVDLGRWLGEEYRVAGPAAADGGDGVPAAPSDD
ncbi:MAG TPA: DNA gyrase inhibitor YacG [Kofleriaceae bacterium]|nr:DNA gyrase inhibitor YacG [Kofleriaceae bacterium]